MPSHLSPNSRYFKPRESSSNCQVSGLLSHPHAISYMYITPEDQAAFMKTYTAHLIDEVREISGSIPHHKLAYQWDVCQEVLMWEGYFKSYQGYKDDIIRTLTKVGDAVVGSIDMGYHLCYGSPLDEHCVQPRDIGNLVEMANELTAAVSRRIDYIHMPVPKDRNDEAYFAPLADLELSADTDSTLDVFITMITRVTPAKLGLA